MLGDTAYGDGDTREAVEAAGAKVTATFHEEGPQSTRVDVHTDMQITGKPAQFGRGSNAGSCLVYGYAIRVADVATVQPAPDVRSSG